MSLFNSAENIIRNIDFNMLRVQKTALLSIREELLSPEQGDALEGIVNLIDAVQDYAVDVMGMDKYEVFNLSKED